jgi:hypothetical protein
MSRMSELAQRGLEAASSCADICTSLQYCFPLQMVVKIRNAIITPSVRATAVVRPSVCVRKLVSR